MWKDIIKNHIELSEAKAETYDNAYGSLVTKNYMSYEKLRLNTAIKQLNMDETDLAVDIGCGTGRCTLDLSHSFQKVIGIDFSPKMLEMAKRNANCENISNTQFELRDVSTDGFGNFETEAAFLNFSFGMGSFFENPRFLMSEIKRVLSKNGIVHITFYNRDSYVCKLASTIDMGVSALPFPDLDQLIVDNVCIPCKFYSIEKVKKMFQDSFEQISTTTYPTILPLIKKEALLYPDVLQQCESLECNLLNKNYGYYISSIYKKI